MITLPPNMQAHAEAKNALAAWIWLLEIEVVPADPPTVPQATLMRFCTHHEEIQWPLGDPDNTTWYPFAFEVGGIEVDGSGDLPQLDVSMSNVTRFPMQFLHQTNGMEGRPARLWLISQAGLSIAYPDHEGLSWDLRILAAAATSESVTLRLGMPNFFQRKTPHDYYVANRCRHRYGGPACGYVRNAVAGFQTCNHSLSDCQKRGDDEVARNLPRLHPRRFGGFPGIPQQQIQ